MKRIPEMQVKLLVAQQGSRRGTETWHLGPRADTDVAESGGNPFPRNSSSGPAEGGSVQVCCSAFGAGTCLPAAEHPPSGLPSCKPEGEAGPGPTVQVETLRLSGAPGHRTYWWW